MFSAKKGIRKAKDLHLHADLNMAFGKIWRSNVELSELDI